MSALWVGPVALTGFVLGWLAVQALWRRMFDAGAETDALAGRSCCARACRSCTCQERRSDAEDEQHLFIPKEQGHG